MPQKPDSARGNTHLAELLALASQGAQAADELLTPSELSKEIKTPQKTLAQWRYRHEGPPFLKLGDGPNAPVRYRRSEIRKWLAGLRTGGAA
jgi:hypothetical protein